MAPSAAAENLYQYCFERTALRELHLFRHKGKLSVVRLALAGRTFLSDMASQVIPYFGSSCCQESSEKIIQRKGKEAAVFRQTQNHRN